MGFVNNIEKMAYLQSGWALVEENEDGSCIYLGKPLKGNATIHENVWSIMRIEVINQRLTDGRTVRTTRTQKAEGYHSWSDKEKLTYQYI